MDAKPMIQNRELSMDDYLAMLRRRLKVILVPALLARLGEVGRRLRHRGKVPSLLFGDGAHAVVLRVVLDLG